MGGRLAPLLTSASCVHLLQSGDGGSWEGVAVGAQLAQEEKQEELIHSYLLLLVVLFGIASMCTCRQRLGSGNKAAALGYAHRESVPRASFNALWCLLLDKCITSRLQIALKMSKMILIKKNTKLVSVKKIVVSSEICFPHSENIDWPGAFDG